MNEGDIEKLSELNFRFSMPKSTPIIASGNDNGNDECKAKFPYPARISPVAILFTLS